MIAYYGRTEQFFFYPIEAETGVKIPSVSAMQLVSAYLFNAEPSKVQAAAGGTVDNVEQLQTISTWSNTVDGIGKIIALDSVEDDTESNDFEQSYYLAINVKMGTGLDTLAPIIRKITYSRLRVQEGRITVTAADLLKLCPAVKKFMAATALQEYIDSSVMELRDSLNSFERPYADIVNPASLNLAASYLALSNFFMGESRGQGSMEFAHYMQFKEKFDNQMKTIQLIIMPKNAVQTSKIDGGKKGYFTSLRVER